MLRLQRTAIFSKEKLHSSIHLSSRSRQVPLRARPRAFGQWLKWRLAVRHHICQCVQLYTASQKPDGLLFHTKPQSRSEFNANSQLGKNFFNFAESG
jgi:hypothetical protein